MAKRTFQSTNLADSANLERRAAQLASLAALLHTNGCRALNNLFEHDRDNILWLVSDLAAEVRDIVNGDSE